MYSYEQAGCVNRSSQMDRFDHFYCLIFPSRQVMTSLLHSHSTSLKGVLFTAVLLALAPARAIGQNEGTTALARELCQCMERIQPESSDRALEASFRTCLENGILAHPSTIRALLAKAPAGVGPGYGLGVVLGDLLKGQCPHLTGMRERLRKAIGSGEGPPGTT